VGHDRRAGPGGPPVLGPRDALYFLSARIEDVMPVTGLAGNVTLVFSALSYCGRLDVVVNADAESCPDVGVLVSGMERAWAALTSGARAASARGAAPGPCEPW
jgi:WS/DGAT C-terminal domain